MTKVADGLGLEEALEAAHHLPQPITVMKQKETGSGCPPEPHALTGFGRCLDYGCVAAEVLLGGRVWSEEVGH